MLLSLYFHPIFSGHLLLKDSVTSDNCIIKIFTWLIKLFRSTYCLVKIHGKPHVHAVPHKLYTAAGPAKLWYHPYCKTKTTTKHQKSTFWISKIWKLSLLPHSNPNKDKLTQSPNQKVVCLKTLHCMHTCQLSWIIQESHGYYTNS